MSDRDNPPASGTETKHDHRTPLDDDQACMACEAEAREAA